MTLNLPRKAGVACLLALSVLAPLSLAGCDSGSTSTTPTPVTGATVAVPSPFATNPASVPSAQPSGVPAAVPSTQPAVTGTATVVR